MGVSRSLNSIDVGYNGIDQAAALELLAAMKEKAMVSIGMADCELGVEGAKVVAEMAAVSRSLTVADVRFNKMGTESATMLASIAKEKKISLCGITPEQTEANLEGSYPNIMGPADAILLTADLAVRRSLTECNLRDNNLGKESW